LKLHALLTLDCNVLTTIQHPCLLTFSYLKLFDWESADNWRRLYITRWNSPHRVCSVTQM